MLIVVDVAPGVPRVDDDHGDRVPVSKCLQAIKVHLPASLRYEVEVPGLHAVEDGTRLVEQVAGPWEQDVGTMASQGRADDLDRLGAAACELDVVG
jgi:hypothetical protein